ncbi:MAG: hypothetical protein K2I11_11655 [Bacteroides sp.]|nr:hypothetical protein [Bacteroides sp.]
MLLPLSANLLAVSCRQVGKALPARWQAVARTLAKLCQRMNPLLAKL